MILTHPAGLCPALRGPNAPPLSYGAALALGQSYEDLLVYNLTQLGLESYRPSQVFICPYQRQLDRRAGKCHLKPYGGQLVSIGHRPDLLRPYQRDVLVKVSKVRRLSLEVKALTPLAFQQSLVHFGCTAKWDSKMYRVDAIVLINQQTLEAWVVPADPEAWNRVRAIRGNGYDYAIPRSLLTPLAAWVSYIQGLITSQDETARLKTPLLVPRSSGTRWLRHRPIGA